MSKKMKITIDEWIGEAFKELPPKPENAFTVADVCAKTGMNNRTVISRMERLVQLGKLKKGKCQVNGVAGNYYIPVEFLNNETKRIERRTITGNKNVPGTTTGKSKKGISAKNGKNGKRT
jgi:hypothetical protein